MVNGRTLVIATWGQPASWREARYVLEDGSEGVEHCTTLPLLFRRYSDRLGRPEYPARLEVLKRSEALHWAINESFYYLISNELKTIEKSLEERKPSSFPTDRKELHSLGEPAKPILSATCCTSCSTLSPNR